MGLLALQPLPFGLVPLHLSFETVNSFRTALSSK
jgi:hypothetical protein